jgi:hypothetical protein
MLGILAILLVASFASALQVSPNPIVLSATSGMTNSTTFNLTNNELSNWTSLNIIPIIGGVSVSPGYSLSLPNGSSQLIIVSATGFTSNASTSLNISYDNGSFQSQLIPLNITISSSTIPTSGFCTYGKQGSNLSISDISINNNGEGEDDEWYYLDDISIDVEVSNNANKRMSDVEVEIGIFKGSDDVTDDFDLEDEKISLGSISEDDEETATFEISNIPVDLDEGDYTIKFKTYVKGDENIVCDEDSETVQVSNPYGEGVIVANGVIGDLIEVTAGQTLNDIVMDVINLGSSKEDEVLVNIYNRELGIDENYHLSDLSPGSDDSELISFSGIVIPSIAFSKNYQVEVRTFFEYDDGDVTETSSYDSNSYDDLEDDYNTFYFTLKVVGGEVVIDPNKPILGINYSNAFVGREMKVELTITNNGLVNINNALVAISDFESWAQLKPLSNNSVMSIARGQSKTVVLTFIPSEEGQHTFNINLVYDGKTMVKPVSVDVKKQTNVFSSFFENATATTYLIVGIIVLVVLIVLVLVIKAVVSRKE